MERPNGQNLLVVARRIYSLLHVRCGKQLIQNRPMGPLQEAHSFISEVQYLLFADCSFVTTVLICYGTKWKTDRSTCWAINAKILIALHFSNSYFELVIHAIMSFNKWTSLYWTYRSNNFLNVNMYYEEINPTLKKNSPVRFEPQISGMQWWAKVN